jgi:hypothetical protein
MNPKQFEAIAVALAAARAEHDPLHSVHEAIGVILEEWNEAQEEAFRKVIDRAALRKELQHLAAMCARAIEDLGL